MDKENFINEDDNNEINENYYDQLMVILNDEDYIKKYLENLENIMQYNKSELVKILPSINIQKLKELRRVIAETFIEKFKLDKRLVLVNRKIKSEDKISNDIYYRFNEVYK